MSNLMLAFPILFPIAAGLLHYPIKFKTNRTRNLYVMLAVMISSLSAWMLIVSPPEKSLVILEFANNLDFSLKLDGAGRVFACLSATLWPITALYAFEYMEKEEHLHMFYTFFIFSFSATMGIAMADNLLTMYLFYELLTLFTLPLVMHGMGHIHRMAARKYMIYSIGGAALAFSGVAFFILNGANEFSLGGSLPISADKPVGLVIFAVTFLGFGVKSALFPLHAWLPSASVAPTPVTALLHAVAVVKSGAFAIIRLVYYSFGIDFLQGTWGQDFAMIIATVTILFGSVSALKQTHFKRRLAYSTVSNLSYIIFAVTVMTTGGLIAAFTHMLFHSVIKICAFFAAGAVLHKTEKEYVSELEGLGKQMPVTFACFTVSALALTGIPPLCGFISKWYIATAATESGNYLAIVGVTVLLISALLTAIYMIIPAIKAFFPNKDTQAVSKRDDVGLRMAIPMIVCAACCILGGIFAQPITDLLTEVLGI